MNTAIARNSPRSLTWGSSQHTLAVTTLLALLGCIAQECSCQCASHYLYNPAKGTCKFCNTVPGYQLACKTWKSATCVQAGNASSICRVGYEATCSAWNTATCRSCPDYTYYGPTNCSTCSSITGHQLRCLSWKNAKCEPCVPGNYLATNGTIKQCLPCPTGTFSNTTGSTTCFPCAAQTFANQTGSTSCKQCQKCATGKYSTGCNSTSAGICQSCPDSTYDTLSNCASCNPATGYQLRCLSWKHAKCETCTPGTYSANNSTAKQCIPCPVGTFSSAYGSTACLACPDYTFSNQTGSSACATCQKCAMGQYNYGCSFASNGTCVNCTSTPQY